MSDKGVKGAKSSQKLKACYMDMWCIVLMNYYECASYVCNTYELLKRIFYRMLFFIAHLVFIMKY